MNISSYSVDDDEDDFLFGKSVFSYQRNDLNPDVLLTPIPQPKNNIFDIRPQLDQDDLGRRRFLIVGLNYECNIFNTFFELVSYLSNTFNSRIQLSEEERKGKKSKKYIGFDKIEPFWIDVQSPSKEDLEGLERYFNLHKLTTEDCLDNDSGEKLEMFPNYLFVCIRTVDRLIENQFEELNVILFKRFVITIHRGHFEELELVTNRIESEFESGLTEDEKRLLFIQDIDQKYNIDRLRKKVENRPESSSSSSSSPSSSSSTTSDEGGDKTKSNGTKSNDKGPPNDDDIIFEKEVRAKLASKKVEEEDEGESESEEEEEEGEKKTKTDETFFTPKKMKKNESEVEKVGEIGEEEEKEKEEEEDFGGPDVSPASPKTFSSVMVKLREKKRRRKMRRRVKKMTRSSSLHDEMDFLTTGLTKKERKKVKKQELLEDLMQKERLLHEQKRQVKTSKRVKLTRIPHASWILYAFLDVMTDMYVPLTEGLHLEVESVDESVLEITTDSEKIDLLRRLGMTKNQINRLKKLLITKQNIVQLLRANNTMRFISNETSLYLRDVVDHLNQCLQNLDSAKESLTQSHSNYMIKVSIEIANSSQKTDIVMNRITLFASLFTPVALVSGIWGMNMPVPGQDGYLDFQNTLWWFWGVVAGSFLLAAITVIVLGPQIYDLKYYQSLRGFLCCGYCPRIVRRGFWKFIRWREGIQIGRSSSSRE